MRIQSARVTTVFRILLLLSLLLITYLTLARLSPSGSASLINDKVAHFLAFFCLTIAVEASFPNIALKYKVLVLAAYGMGIELAQMATGYRYFSWLDWLADVAGIVAFIPCMPLFERCLVGLGLAKPAAARMP